MNAIERCSQHLLDVWSLHTVGKRKPLTSRLDYTAKVMTETLDSAVRKTARTSFSQLRERAADRIRRRLKIDHSAAPGRCVLKGVIKRTPMMGEPKVNYDWGERANEAALPTPNGLAWTTQGALRLYRPSGDAPSGAWSRKGMTDFRVGSRRPPICTARGGAGRDG